MNEVMFYLCQCVRFSVCPLAYSISYTRILIKFLGRVRGAWLKEQSIIIWWRFDGPDHFKGFFICHCDSHRRPRIKHEKLWTLPVISALTVSSIRRLIMTDSHCEMASSSETVTVNWCKNTIGSSFSVSAADADLTGLKVRGLAKVPKNVEVQSLEKVPLFLRRSEPCYI